MTRLIAISFFVLQIAILVQCNGLYSIIGPGVLRSKSNYSVTVTIHDASSPCKIKVGLIGKDLNAFQTVNVPPKSSKVVKFEVPKLKGGDYNLTAEGLSGIEFKNTTKLDFAEDTQSIYIQTDKATYKPGDKVQYRVLVVDKNTRPAKIDEPISITINDGARNLIKQIKDAKLIKGVFSGELQLSEFPVLGSWDIEVKIGESTEVKNFDVDKYVLPKFEVVVEAPKDVAFDDKTFRVTVRAKYTYGKPVKGKAVVTAKPSYYYFGDKDAQPAAEKTVDIDGKGHVEFDIVKDLKMEKDRYNPPVTILAIVEEELTGSKQNSTATVNIHREKYQIEGIDTPYTYYPGKPVIINLVVKNLDGSPVQDTKNLVTLTVSEPDYWFNPGPIRPIPIAMESSDVSTYSTPIRPPPMSKNYTSTLDKNGMAKFEITLPEGNASYYSVKATFLDTSAYLTSLSRSDPSETPADKSLKITIQTKNPSLGNEVSVKISYGCHIPYFVYTIVGRGNILLSKLVKVPENRDYHIFKFTPTFAMIPHATIMCHFVEGTDLKYAEQSIEFANSFQNSISIDAPVQAKPGEDIEIEVSTDPDSFVGLLGVDQSVLLLKSGNDLQKDAIFNNLRSYDTHTPWQGYGMYPGTQSGVVTLTNANYPYQNIYFYTSPRLVVSTPVFTTNIPPTTQSGLSANAQSSGSEGILTVRKNFVETWIWNDLDRSVLVLVAF